MTDGAVWYSWIDYNGATGTLEVRLSESNARPLTASLSVSGLDLGALLGSSDVYAGFTGGTGGSWENQDILFWQLNDSYSPIGVIGGAVPEPSTYGLGAAALLGGLALWRRRKRKA